MDFLLNPLSFSDEEEENHHHHHRPENIAALLAAESGQSTSFNAGALNLSTHQETMALILKAQSSHKLDQSVCYLAINYVHRYLSIQQTNYQDTKPWAAALLAAACLSLASKMTMAPFTAYETQIDNRFKFTAAIVGRMEFLVVGALQWRMRSITPFAFLRYFLSLSSPGDPKVPRDITARASKALFEAQTVMKFMQYRPSVVAAAALVTSAAVAGETWADKLEGAINGCGFLNNEIFWECCDALKKETTCTIDTPRTVLTYQFSEDKSTSGSLVNVQDLRKQFFNTMTNEITSQVTTEVEKEC